MKRTSLYAFILLATVCCHRSFEDNSDISNELLIMSSKKFAMSDGGQIDEKYGSTQAFQQHHLKIEYLTDTIHAQAIHYINACGDARAWVEKNGATLILSTKERAEELCASGDWYLYDYWIENRENLKYTFIQKE